MVECGWDRLRQTFVQLLKSFELGCEAAFAGGIYDEDDFALEVGEGVLFALLVLGLEVIERCCGSHGCVGMEILQWV